LLLEAFEEVVYRLGLRFALVLFEIGPKLLLCLAGIEKKFLPGAEDQPADVAIGHARGFPNEPRDLEISL
jgi:hypothetical protein